LQRCQSAFGFLDGLRGGLLLTFEIAKHFGGFGGAKVDAGIFADGARERAQIGNGGEGVFRLATAHLGVGLAQPVVEVVLIKSAEGKIVGRGFVPFGRKFVEAALDQTFFFGGERAGEGEGLLFFVPGAIVVAENGPGFGQGGMGEREVGRIFDGFLQRIDGTFGVHAAQLVDTNGIQLRGERGGRDRGFQNRFRHGGPAFQTQFLTELYAGAADQLHQVGHLRTDGAHAEGIDGFAGAGVLQAEVQLDGTDAGSDIGTGDDVISA